MPFRFAKENADNPNRVRNRIQQLVATNALPSLKGVAFETSALNHPHTVYGLHAGSFINGKSLADSAHHNGQRYIVHSAGQPYLAAEIQKHTSAPGGHIVHLNIGQFVAGTSHALKQLAQLPPVKFGSFEARLLRSFHLYFVGIWLKSDTGEHDDLIYPLPGGAPAPFQAGQLYSLSDFRNNINILVQKRRTAP